MKESSIIPEIVDSSLREELEPLCALTHHEIELKETLETQIADGIKLSMEGFYLIGSALRKLKELKLYRNTYRRFEQYASERFKISKRYQYYLMNAVEVIDALGGDQKFLESVKGRLPSLEFHCRELLKMGSEPSGWKKAWTLSLIEADYEVPTAKTVRSVVRQLKSQTVEVNPFQIGDICLIEPKDNRELAGLHGCWGIIVAKNLCHCDIKTCLGLKKKIPSQYLLPSAYTTEQLSQIEKICRLLEMIPAHIRKEETVIALLKIYGKRFVLSDVEADVLTTLLKQ